MPRKIGLALGAAAGAGAVLAARRFAYAPLDLALEQRADEAQFSGPWSHNFAEVNGVRLHYAELGSGPLVILLHGFPECWYAWREVGPLLAQNFRLVAPDMRGYNLSAKPHGIAEYDMDKLTGDVAALIEHLGETKAYVVGHDWGGGVAWQFGIDHPEYINKLAVINAPHPAALLREFRHSDQAIRSYYMYLFQLPLFPEAALRRIIRRSLATTTAEPGVFDQQALDVYENNISQPGAATAMIDYYRAVVRRIIRQRGKAAALVSVPTLLLWGMQDFALVPGLSENLEQWVPDLRVVRNPAVSHWVPEEAPQWVADNLTEFFSN